MRACPDCRYCDPATGNPDREGLPNPAQWFDQPCPHCFHRLRAHDPGVPRELTSLSAAVVPVEPVVVDR